MNKIKSWSLATCVVLSSFTMFGASVLAAPAIVQSDPNLNFDNVKLQKTLTNISDKNKQLNITFYSLNNIDDTKAVITNDNFISSGVINTNDYVTLVFNRNVNYPDKGSFSANIGASYRDYITKNEITNDIINPNVKKYMPQNPQGFTVVVAEQISDKIQAKKGWNDFVAFNTKVAMIVFFGGLLFVFVYLSIKALVEHLTINLNEYKRYKALLETVNTKYSKLVEQSTYLSGYTGKTGEKANYFLERINKVNEQYLALKALPKFINVIFETSEWADYTSKLYNLNSDLTVDLENIDAFLKSIEGKPGTDPLAEIIRLQELKDKQDKLDSLVNTFNQQYQDGSNFLANSLVHGRSNQGKAFLDSNYDINTKIDFYNDSLEIINKEVILINRLYRLKQDVKEVANYIVNNNNTYYSNLTPITKEVKDWAQNLLITVSNYNNYYEPSNVEAIKQELDFFAIDYKQQDAQYRVTNERKASLINKVNITVPKKFAIVQDVLLTQIRNINLASSYKSIEEDLERLESEVNTLLKDVKEYKSRQTKLSKYSGTRKQKLEEQLENRNYTNFDVLVVNYTNEDSSSSYSTPSSSSYSSRSNSSSYYTPSSSSSYSSSSSSSDNSWSSSSSSSSSDYGSDSSSSSSDYGSDSSSTDSSW